MRHRLRHPLSYGQKFVSRAEPREQQDPLKHCKPCPGTDPRTRRKRDEGGALAVFSVLTVPTLRIEPIGIVPQPHVTMQMPGAQHDLTSRRHITTAKRLRLSRLSHHHRHRWVQAQSFAKHVSGDRQPPQILKARLLPQSLPLAGHFVLIFWMDRHEVKRP